MSANDIAPSAARRTIADLPTELKALIARIAHREWSALAATELFERITSKNCDSVIFRSSIVRRYANKIKHVSFVEEGGYSDAEILLSAMRQFSNLTSITLDTESSSHLFGVHSAVQDLDWEHRIRRQELRDVGRSVNNFEVENLFAPDLLFLLECFPALSSLDIWLHEWTSDDDIDDLTLEIRRQIFAGLYSLRSLTLDSTAIGCLFVPGEPLVDWGLKWSLCRLEVVLHFDQLSAVIALAQHSAGTLTTFKVRTEHNDPPPNDQGVYRLSLPHLSRLHIRATWPQLQALLPLFKTSPITSLHLDVDPPNASALLDLALELFKPHLKKLHIDVKRYSYDASKSIKTALLDTLVSRAAQEGVTLVIVQPRYDVFNDSSKYQDERPLCTVRRCDGVDEVARFALAQSARIRATDDVVAAGQLLNALRPMRARMMWERD